MKHNNILETKSIALQITTEINIDEIRKDIGNRIRELELESKCIKKQSIANRLNNPPLNARNKWVGIKCYLKHK